MTTQQARDVPLCILLACFAGKKRAGERGLVTGIAWGAFGIIAVALFGLTTGRRASARRLKGIGPLVPPGSSVAVGWATDSVPPEATGRWQASGSQRLLVQYVASEDALVPDVPA